MCSVRHSPMPCAPSRRARAASSAVSALARTRSRRARRRGPGAGRPPAPARRSPRRRPPERGVQAVLQVVDHRRGHHRTSPRNTSPVDPSMEMTSPSLITTSPSRGRPAPCVGVHVDRLGPAHAGAAHAAGDHRGVAGLAAAAGQHPVRGDHALEVVRVGLPAHQHHRLARRVPADRRRRVEHRLAHRRTRGRGQALGQQLLLGGRVELREHQPRQLLPADPGSASSSVISCSSTSCAAIRNAAAAVRFPTRVCSIHSLPRSTVNSMSHRSR